MTIEKNLADAGDMYSKKTTLLRKASNTNECAIGPTFCIHTDTMRGTYIRQMEMYLSLVEQLAEEAQQAYTIAVLCYGMMAGLYAK
jgi:hypothetical protein